MTRTMPPCGVRLNDPEILLHTVECGRPAKHTGLHIAVFHDGTATVSWSVRAKGVLPPVPSPSTVPLPPPIQGDPV